MARPSNPDNHYALIDKVTGETKKTNPKQFNDLLKRYNLTSEELLTSYVGRNGRRQIAKEKLSPEEAVEKYGIHVNVASILKCTVKSKTVPAVAPVAETETPTDAPDAVVDTVAANVAETETNA